MTQAAAEITETLPFSQLQPYGDHFHPVRITELGPSKGAQLEPRGFGSPHAALTATPKVDQVRSSRFG
jgi:transcription factor 1